MDVLAIPPFSAALEPEANQTARTRDAAQQFEALLLAQILRSARESGGVFGQSGEASDCANDFAEQQFARVLAQNGGLGLAALIASGLERNPAAATDPAAR